jgi:hypothetical protein
MVQEKIKALILRSLKNKQNGETNSVQKPSLILIPERYHYCSASWFLRKPKYVGQLHSNFPNVITIDLLGHGETECLGYVHHGRQCRCRTFRFRIRHT